LIWGLYIASASRLALFTCREAALNGRGNNDRSALTALLARPLRVHPFTREGELTAALRGKRMIICLPIVFYRFLFGFAFCSAGGFETARIRFGFLIFVFAVLRSLRGRCR
jgi:hypothetical protein